MQEEENTPVVFHESVFFVLYDIKAKERNRTLS